jgi:AAA+ superfamily predicted ATPase
VLFCGPPGCGKTVAAEAIAKEVYLPLAVVRFDAVISSYLGETASNLRKVFEFARSRPMVMLFDEFDAIGKRRTDPDEHGEIKRVVNSFLQMLDGFHGETLTIAATNHQGLLDRALWRRFDDIVFFALPSEREIEKLLIDRLRQIKLSSNVRLPAVARTLLGLAHADVERLAGEIVKRCVLQEKEEIDEALVHEVLQLERSRRDLVADNVAQDFNQKTKKRQPPPRKRKG